MGLAPLDLGERLELEHQLDAEIAAAAARRLRAAAWSMPAVAREDKELHPLLDGSDLCAAEVRVHLRRGAVVRLEYFLLRRVRLGMWEPRLAREMVPRLRELFRQELEWDGARWEKEVDGFERAAEAWAPEGVRG